MLYYNNSKFHKLINNNHRKYKKEVQRNNQIKRIRFKYSKTLYFIAKNYLFTLLTTMALHKYYYLGLFYLLGPVYTFARLELRSRLGPTVSVLPDFDDDFPPDFVPLLLLLDFPPFVCFLSFLFLIKGLKTMLELQLEKLK